MISIPYYELGDEVELKKPHPCMHRSTRFQIVRMGADIKIKCLGCQQILMMSRDHFNHRLKTIITPHPEVK
jgi:hypothetical protein